MRIKNLVSKSLILLLVCSGGFASAKTVQAKTLHPLGLRELHEKMPNIKKVYPEFNKLNSSIYSVSQMQINSSGDLSSFFPAVENQGELGSCTTFATTYDKTYQENLKRNWGMTTQNHIFSPQYIYSQLHADNSADGGGCSYSDAFNLLDSQGCTTLDDMPYSGKLYSYKTKPTATQRTHAANYKEKTWGQLQSGNVEEIKEEIESWNPVLISIPVYPQFDDLSVNDQIYNSTAGKYEGAHALCVVGYDDSRQAVKIINSWGTDWGVDGYGWISYDFLKNNNIDAYVMTDN
ncbi:C1 family peptidase [Clostridium hydrogenum]|uniref:C1 family peptidase n=1 Tax=Clostridium hydrogenum TaxID=2855764 RepID=UPI001F3B19FE|nr:C1 family peptidase [Clostridium hydrogenum]